MVSGQPWGLFFLDFEGLKKLPITFLRKVLNSFARKKSTWATASERMTWDVQDLMFINSITSDGKQSQIFAHFNEREKGLHQLKTFSWDNQESEEHFENIYERNLSVYLYYFLNSNILYQILIRIHKLKAKPYEF